MQISSQIEKRKYTIKLDLSEQKNRMIFENRTSTRDTFNAMRKN